MKFILVIAAIQALIIGTVCQSDLLSELPKCAVECFQETINTSACSATNISCLCADSTFLAAASGCQALNCTVKEVLTSTNATLAACGVPGGDQSATTIGIGLSFGSVAIIMATLRIVDRVWVNTIPLGWDDYLIIVAVLLSLPMNGLCIAASYYGLGKDMWALEFDDIDTTFLLVYVAEIFYMASEAFVQMSLLAFLLRVFNSHRFKTYIWVLMGIVAAFGTSNVFVMIFPNNPIPFFWKGWSGEMVGTGINMNLYVWLRAAIEIAIDVSIIALPIPDLLRLQMSLRKKIQVLAMFCVGFVITLVSILRLQALIQYSKTTNPTYDNTPAIYWSLLECNIFIICACMPAMRPLLKKIAPSCFGSGSDIYAAGPKYGSPNDLGSGGKYYRQTSQNRHTGHRPTQSKSGAIVKAIDVVSYRTERSASDVELVQPGKVYGA